jgi:hypothetical protein
MARTNTQTPAATRTVVTASNLTGEAADLAFIQSHTPAEISAYFAAKTAKVLELAKSTNKSQLVSAEDKAEIVRIDNAMRVLTNERRAILASYGLKKYTPNGRTRKSKKSAE